MEGSSSSGRIDLPPGVQLGAGRETSRTNGQGAVVQGMLYPITLADGTTSSVFIPESDLHNLGRAKQIIDAKVAALQAISG